MKSSTASSFLSFAYHFEPRAMDPPKTCWSLQSFLGHSEVSAMDE